MPGRGAGTVTAPIDGPLVEWSELSAHAPDGLAVVDAGGLFVQLNAAAIALLLHGLGWRDPQDLIGMPAPFELARGLPADAAGLLEDEPVEQVSFWAPAAGVRREFAYRARPLPGPGHGDVDVARTLGDGRGVPRRHRRATPTAPGGGDRADLGKARFCEVDHGDARRAGP